MSVMAHHVDAPDHKPVRNWSDFFKEVGTIVLGVCIALAAEQTVEYFHWRNQVAQARQALRAEIAAIDEFYALRIAIAPCMDRRLDKVDQAIRAIAAGFFSLARVVYIGLILYASANVFFGAADWDKSTTILIVLPSASFSTRRR